MSPRTGDLAPDFTLDGTDGTPQGRRPYRLSDYRGQAVVLVFYPGDNTPVCTRQLVSYTDDFPSFDGVNAQVLALSPQSIESHDKFSAGQGGFAFPLLSDTGSEVGRTYGIVGPLGFYRRSAFVLDGEGVIRWAQRSVTGVRFPSVEVLVEAAREATGS